MNRYFGTYQTFESPTKEATTALLSADSIVGDAFSIEFELHEDTHAAWLVNRFGGRVGCFDPAFSRRLSVMKAQGLEFTAILSYIAYTDNPDKGEYWGEMAVIGYHPSIAEECETFVRTVGARMAEGNRTKIDFGAEGVDKILESGGTWVPDQTVPLPEFGKGAALLRSKQSISEKLIEEGRKGNKGCYVLSWAFIAAVVVGAVLLLKSCVGF